MQYTVKNVTMNIDCVDGDFTGDCMVFIPFKHKSFFKEYCGMEKYIKRNEYDPVFEHMYGEIHVNKDLKHYWSTSPDILIAYLSWLLEKKYKQEVNVQYSNPFWAIHDMEHAQNDESGCTIYVDEHIELQRLKDAFEIFLKEGCELDYELVKEVEEAYNQRFKSNVSFEEYIYNQDFEEELEENYL
jgi:hypothetical protein